GGFQQAAGFQQAGARFFTAAQSCGRAGLARAEQIRAAYKAIPKIWLSTVIGGLLFAVAMSRGLAAETLAAWLMALYAAVSYALLLYFRYTRAAPLPEQAAKWE